MNYQQEIEGIRRRVAKADYRVAVTEVGRVAESLLRELLVEAIRSNRQRRPDDDRLDQAIARTGQSDVSRLAIRQLVRVFREAGVLQILRIDLGYPIRLFWLESLNPVITLRNKAAHQSSTPTRRQVVFSLNLLEQFLFETRRLDAPPTLGLWVRLRRHRALLVPVGAVAIAIVTVVGFRVAQHSSDNQPISAEPSHTQPVSTRADRSEPIPVSIASDSTTLAVLSLENNGTPDEFRSFGKGMAQIITSELSGQADLRLVEREQLSRVIEELQLQHTGLVDATTAQRVGRLVGAEYLLTGSYFSLAESLRVDVKVINVETGEIMLGIGIDAALGEAVAITRDLVGKLLSALEEQGSWRRDDTPSDEQVVQWNQIAQYSRALDLVDSGNDDAAQVLLQDLLVEAPNFRAARALSVGLEAAE